MIYANDETFNIRYNTNLDKLELPNEKKRSRVIRHFNQNKVVTILLVLFVSFSLMNCALIFTFMQLLKNI